MKTCFYLIQILVRSTIISTQSVFTISNFFFMFMNLTGVFWKTCIAWCAKHYKTYFISWLNIKACVMSWSVAVTGKPYPGFCYSSITRQAWVFLLPPGWDASPSQCYTPTLNSLAATCTPVWRKALGTLNTKHNGNSNQTPPNQRFNLVKQWLCTSVIILGAFLCRALQNSNMKWPNSALWPEQLFFVFLFGTEPICKIFSRGKF